VEPEPDVAVAGGDGGGFHGRSRRLEVGGE
jgi:hypothetical protein